MKEPINTHSNFPKFPGEEMTAEAFEKLSYQEKKARVAFKLAEILGDLPVLQDEGLSEQQREYDRQRQKMPGPQSKKPKA